MESFGLSNRQDIFLFSAQDFEDIEATGFVFGLFLAQKIFAFIVMGNAVGIGSSCLYSLLAGGAIYACIDKLAATAAGVSDFAAHGELAMLNHLGGNDQRGACLFDNIAGRAVGMSFYIFLYFYFVIPISIITFLADSRTAIGKQLAAKRTVLQDGAFPALIG